MQETTVYLALGANIGDARATVRLAMQRISQLDRVVDFAASRLYETAPVSPIQQENFINAVARLRTSMELPEVWIKLQQIEQALGKKAKPRDYPRVIDIDLLFFGQQAYRDDLLEVPHPRWRTRLFVLVPLLDLTSEIVVPDPLQKGKLERLNIQELINNQTADLQQFVQLAEDQVEALGGCDRN